MKCELCGKESDSLISLGRSSFVQTINGKSTVSTVVILICEQCAKNPNRHLQLMKIEKISPKE